MVFLFDKALYFLELNRLFIFPLILAMIALHPSFTISPTNVYMTFLYKQENIVRELNSNEN